MAKLDVFRYPPARWRLVSFDQLEQVTLWFGHLAIRHELSRTEALRPPGWRPDGPNPNRSPVAAVVLAHELHARLVRAPDEFESLARQHSEDPVTKEIGGYWGGVRASQLVNTGFLDVLATLKPGEVSKPFQTPYGIHILKRYPAPALERVSGERVVIGYEGVYELGREAPRSRAEALALARQVASRARAAPASFGALVAQYSDNVDSAIRGDMGVYSTQDPRYLPLEVDGLSRLKVGDIYGPVDSRLGFEILRRVPVVAHQEYAMSAIEVALDSRLDEQTAVHQASAKMAPMQQALAADPGRFEELQRIHRAGWVRRWTYPQGDLNLTHALDNLALGQIAPEPMRYGMTLLIVKRLDPKSLPPQPAQAMELPSPSEPDYDALIGYNTGTQLAAAARAFLAELRRSSDELTPKALDLIATTLDKVAASLSENEVDSTVVRTAIHAAFASLQLELDADSYRILLSAGRKWVIQQMMPDAEFDAPGERRGTAGTEEHSNTR